MILGKCPYCEDGSIEVRKKLVQGKKVELYACSNASWYSEDNEVYELSKDSTCSFKIWQNSLKRYGKYLTHKDIRTLLQEEDLIVTFYTQNYKKKVTYEKYIILDEEYGVSVLWEIDINS